MSAGGGGPAGEVPSSPEAPPGRAELSFAQRGHVLEGRGGHRVETLLTSCQPGGCGCRRNCPGCRVEAGITGPGGPLARGEAGLRHERRRARGATGTRCSTWGSQEGGRVILETGERVNAGVKRPVCPSWSGQACGSGVGDGCRWVEKAWPPTGAQIQGKQPSSWLGAPRGPRV